MNANASGSAPEAAAGAAPPSHRAPARSPIWLARLAHHEFWPTWALYAPLLPYLACLALRYGGAGTFTCCNPGIANGGGLIGESKSDILSRLGTSPLILDAARIDSGPAGERLTRLRVEMARLALAFPLILKPDAGQRGHAVKLVSDEDDAAEYLREMSAAAVAQRYHEGPHEVGVLWMRHPPRTRGPAPTGQGFIFSMTRKEFPVVVGDGRRRVRELIRAHPRYRLQREVFERRLGEGVLRVPGAGERVRLALAGNHAQGTLFRDGMDLWSPALEATIDALAASFRGGLDIGRFDLRYADEADLRAGRNFAVVELNGTTSESTSIYDPSRSLVWALGVMARQWRGMYELGAWRRTQGVTPLTLARARALLREHAAGVRGNPVSD